MCNARSSRGLPLRANCRRNLLAVALVASLTLTGAIASAAPMAYVPNQKSGTISVIDTGSDTVVKTLSGGSKLGKRLQAIDASNDGNTL